DLIQRKDASDLDGAHLRLLFVRYKDVIVPALEDLKRRDPTRYALLLVFLDQWTEIQWILYSDPEVRKFRGVRLRLHILTFLRLEQARELFPPQPVVSGRAKGKHKYTLDS